MSFIIQRTIYLLFAVFLVFLSGCGGSESPETNQIDPPESSGPLSLIVNGISDYTVVRSDYSNGPDVKAAILICSAIEEQTGVRPAITTDWDGNPVTEREIIVGETLRETTEDYYVDRTALGKNGFIIEAVGEKLFITGGSDEATYTAAEYFIETFVNGENVFIERDYKYTVFQEFDIRSFYICGADYRDFIIICDAETLKKTGEELSAVLADKTGKKLEVIVDKDYHNYGNIILLTEEKPDTDGIHLVRAEDGRLIFSSSGARNGVAQCVDSFITRYLTGARGDCRVSEGFIYAVSSDYITIQDPRSS